jgi:hypothetical protein
VFIGGVISDKWNVYPEFESGPARADKGIRRAWVSTDGLLEGCDIVEVVEIAVSDTAMPVEVGIAAGWDERSAKAERW